jgi:hypothetical protein
MKRTFKIVLVILLVLIVGTVIGVGSVILVAFGGVGNGIVNGPWRANTAAGSVTADPYMRIRVAIHGLLALNSSETIYYSARVDDDGNALNSDYTYRIEGKALDTRWWSITAYGAGDHLIANALNRYSYTGNNVTFDVNGKFTIFVSKNNQQGNWLPLNDQKRFYLTLRLYNPGDAMRDSLNTVELPHIIREAGK